MSISTCLRLSILVNLGGPGDSGIIQTYLIGVNQAVLADLFLGMMTTVADIFLRLKSPKSLATFQTACHCTQVHGPHEGVMFGSDLMRVLALRFLRPT